MVAGVHTFGLCRRYPTFCDVPGKLFVSSERFECVRGKEYWRNGELWFPECEDVRSVKNWGLYNSEFGWLFAHTGVVYAHTDENCRLAQRRQTACREPYKRDEFTPTELHYVMLHGYSRILFGAESGDVVTDTFNWDWEMRQNQRVFITISQEEIIRAAHSQLGFPTFDTNKVDSAYETAEITHPKQQLRRDCLEELERNATIGNKFWITSVALKMKLNELAKNGKYPRTIVDLGVAASLEGAKWTGEFKHWLADRAIVIRNHAYIFCAAPNPLMVGQYFADMYNHPYKVLLVVFSDDSIISVQESPGHYVCYNMDIASCDTSHTELAFDFYCKLGCCPSEIRQALVNQILAPIIVRNVTKQYLAILKPLGKYMQSGITATTGWNSSVALLMLLAIAKLGMYSKIDIMVAIASVGYKVTLDLCEIPDDLQFLKMSYVLGVDGNRHATINLGAILRASGRCRKGDLPRSSKKSNVIDDAMKFQNSVMSGLLSKINHPMLNKLAPLGIVRNRENYDLAAQNVDMLQFYDHFSGSCVDYDDHLFDRYRLTSAEIEQFKFDILSSRFGTIAYGSYLEKIYSKDYALGCPLLC